MKKKLSILLDPKTNYHGRFVEGMMKAGANEEASEKFWNELLDFASYAFNKSHAAVYAYIAYYTAWLKHHFPAEYMCSCMTRTAWTKIPALLSECKKISLEILPPDINSSSIDFSNIENAILFGFNDIKGVGNAGDLIVAERKANGNFHSVKDFIYRMLTSAENTRSLSQSVIVTLIESGAMDSFCSGNRAILLHGLDDFITISKKLYTKKKLVAKRQEELENMEALSESVHETIDEKAYKKLSRSIETAKTACQRLQEEFDSFAFLPSGEDISSKLQKEYEHLGAYLTGSPIAQYAEAISQIKNVSDIADLDNSGNTMICGAIKTLEIKQRKKDGKEFGIFVLFDQSDEIEVKCFTKEFEKYRDIITVGKVVAINGRIDYDEEFESKSVTVVSMKVLAPTSNKKIIVSGESLLAWKAAYHQILNYKNDAGIALYFLDRSTKELRRANFRVSETLATAHIEELTIM